MAELTYNEEQRQKNTIHLREIISQLPGFADVFFRSIAQNTSVKTRIEYAYDLKIFFAYLTEYHPRCKEKNISDIDISDLKSVQSEDIDRFME